MLEPGAWGPRREPPGPSITDESWRDQGGTATAEDATLGRDGRKHPGFSSTPSPQSSARVSHTQPRGHPAAIGAWERRLQGQPCCDRAKRGENKEGT